MLNLRKKIKRFNLLLSRYLFNKKITKKYLLNQLSMSGITAQDTIMVHSSMSKMGYLEDGPTTLIRALQEILSPTGLLVLPSFPHNNMFHYLESGCSFNLLTSPSKNGAISEVFRTSTDVYRSLHPTHPVLAWGKNAQDFVSGHHQSLSPFDPFSPYKKLIDLNAKIILIGVDFENMTLCRAIEDLIVDYPKPYLKKKYEVSCIDEHGKEWLVTCPCHDPKLSKQRFNMAFYPYLLKQNKIKDVRLGKAKTMIVNAQDLFNIQKELHAKNIYGYTT